MASRKPKKNMIVLEKKEQCKQVEISKEKGDKLITSLTKLFASKLKLVKEDIQLVLNSVEFKKIINDVDLNNEIKIKIKINKREKEKVKGVVIMVMLVIIAKFVRKMEQVVKVCVMNI